MSSNFLKNMHFHHIFLISSQWCLSDQWDSMIEQAFLISSFWDFKEWNEPYLSAVFLPRVGMFVLNFLPQ